MLRSCIYRLSLMLFPLLSLLVSVCFFGAPAHAEDADEPESADKSEPAKVYVGGGLALRPTWSQASGFTFGGEELQAGDRQASCVGGFQRRSFGGEFR